MKRLTLIMCVLLSSISLYAQEEYNRLLLHSNGNNTKGFIIEKIDSLTFNTVGDEIEASINIKGVSEAYNINNIDSISFASVQGSVAAEVDIISSSISSVTVNITRTPSCVGFKMACMPSNSISSLPDDYLADYINKNITAVYYENFTERTLNVSLNYNTGYTILTVAIDEYGLLCELSKASFTTPQEDISGDTDVTVEIIENNLYDFTVKFTPNDDVAKYNVMVGEKGAIESQFNMFASVFGWANISMMLKDWGLEFSGEATHQWTDKSPNTEYEIFVQPWNNEGAAAPHTVFTFRTMANGGEGIAKVDITLGAYTLNDWGGNMLPSQFLTFTPNDQTSAYRIGVYLAENYNADVAGYQEDLCSDPAMPTEGWFQYEELTTDYQINPGISCVAIAAAKNANNEWGPVTELFFTTPDEMPRSSENDKTIVGRHEIKDNTAEPVFIKYEISE